MHGSVGVWVFGCMDEWMDGWIGLDWIGLDWIVRQTGRQAHTDIWNGSVYCFC